MGLAVAGILVLVLVAQLGPGVAYPDTVRQFQQFRTGEYDDWHPPVLSSVWGAFGGLLGFPRGLFVADVVIVVGAAVTYGWALTRQARRVAVRVAGPLLGAAIVLYPPVLVRLLAVVKDVPFMGLALLWCVLVPLTAGSNWSGRRRAAALLTTALIAVAVAATRSEGVAVLVPGMAVLAAAPLYRLGSRRVPRHAGALTGIALPVVALVSALVPAAVTAGAAAVLLQPQPQASYQYVLLHDLAAISVQTGEDLIPKAFSEGADLAFLRRYTNSTLGDSLFWPYDDPGQRLVFRFDPASVAALRSTWVQAVREHPVLYMRHRASVAVQFLALPSVTPWPSVPELGAKAEDPSGACAVARGLSCTAPDGALALSLAEWDVRNKDSLLRDPWLYLLLDVVVAIGIGSWAARRRGFGPALLPWIVAVSGLAHAAALFLVVPGYDYRYSGWLMLSGVAAAVGACVVLVLALLSAPRADDRAGAAPGAERKATRS